MKAHSSEDGGPSQLRGLLSGGWTPGRQRNPDPLQKTTGLAPPLNTGTHLAGSLNPAKPRKPARLADPARHVDSASTTSTRQPNPVQPRLPQLASSTRGMLRNPAAGQLPSHPGCNDGDETSINDDRGNSAPPMPLVSWSVATVPLTYPLTRAGVATVPPPSPLTTASGNLTESTVRDSTRPRPDDRQDGAQPP